MKQYVGFLRCDMFYVKEIKFFSRWHIFYNNEMNKIFLINSKFLNGDILYCKNENNDTVRYNYPALIENNVYLGEL